MGGYGEGRLPFALILATLATAKFLPDLDFLLFAHK